MSYELEFDGERQPFSSPTTAAEQDEWEPGHLAAGQHASDYRPSVEIVQTNLSTCNEKAGEYMYNANVSLLDRNPQVGGACGLVNLGNTCYFNAAVQCVLSVPQLANFFLHEDGGYRSLYESALGTEAAAAASVSTEESSPDVQLIYDSDEIPCTQPVPEKTDSVSTTAADTTSKASVENSQSKLSLATLQLCGLMSQAWSGRHSELNPSGLHSAVGDVHNQFKNFLQHDSQELLTFLLNSVHEDIQNQTKVMKSKQRTSSSNLSCGPMQFERETKSVAEPTPATSSCCDVGHVSRFKSQLSSCREHDACSSDEVHNPATARLVSGRDAAGVAASDVKFAPPSFSEDANVVQVKALRRSSPKQGGLDASSPKVPCISEDDSPPTFCSSAHAAAGLVQPAPVNVRTKATVERLAVCQDQHTAARSSLESTDDDDGDDDDDDDDDRQVSPACSLPSEQYYASDAGSETEDYDERGNDTTSGHHCTSDSLTEHMEDSTMTIALSHENPCEAASGSESNEDTIVSDTFQGEFRSQIVCSKCKKASIRKEPFLCLSVPLPGATETQLSIVWVPMKGLKRRYLITLHKRSLIGDVKKKLCEVLASDFGEDAADIGKMVAALVRSGYVRNTLIDGVAISSILSSQELYIFETNVPNECPVAVDVDALTPLISGTKLESSSLLWNFSQDNKILKKSLPVSDTDSGFTQSSGSSTTEAEKPDCANYSSPATHSTLESSVLYGDVSGALPDIHSPSPADRYMSSVHMSSSSGGGRTDGYLEKDSSGPAVTVCTSTLTSVQETLSAMSTTPLSTLTDTMHTRASTGNVSSLPPPSSSSSSSSAAAATSLSQSPVDWQRPGASATVVCSTPVQSSAAAVTTSLHSPVARGDCSHSPPVQQQQQQHSNDSGLASRASVLSGEDSAGSLPDKSATGMSVASTYSSWAGTASSHPSSGLTTDVEAYLLENSFAPVNVEQAVPSPQSIGSSGDSVTGASEVSCDSLASTRHAFATKLTSSQTSDGQQCPVAAAHVELSLEGDSDSIDIPVTACDPTPALFMESEEDARRSPDVSLDYALAMELEAEDERRMNAELDLTSDHFSNSRAEETGADFSDLVVQGCSINPDKLKSHLSVSSSNVLAAGVDVEPMLLENMDTADTCSSIANTIHIDEKSSMAAAAVIVVATSPAHSGVTNDVVTSVNDDVSAYVSVQQSTALTDGAPFQDTSMLQCPICMDDKRNEELMVHKGCSALLCKTCVEDAKNRPSDTRVFHCHVCQASANMAEDYVPRWQNKTPVAFNIQLPVAIRHRTHPNEMLLNQFSSPCVLFLINVPNHCDAAELYSIVRDRLDHACSLPTTCSGSSLSLSTAALKSRNAIQSGQFVLSVVDPITSKCSYCSPFTCPGCVVPRTGIVQLRSSDVLAVTFNISLHQQCIDGLELIMNDASIADYRDNDFIPLSQCLEDFIKIEQLGGSDPFDCPHCESKQEAVKSITVSRLPPVLLLQLKRFTCDGAFGGEKLENAVRFALTEVDFSSVLYAGSEDDDVVYTDTGSDAEMDTGGDDDDDDDDDDDGTCGMTDVCSRIDEDKLVSEYDNQQKYQEDDECDHGHQEHGYTAGDDALSVDGKAMDMSGVSAAPALSSTVKQDHTDRTAAAKECVYDVTAFICHSGGLRAGHYTAFARHPVNLQWYYYNDRHVVQRTPTLEDMDKAYVLVYSKHVSQPVSVPTPHWSLELKGVEAPPPAPPPLLPPPLMSAADVASFSPCDPVFPANITLRHDPPSADTTRDLVEVANRLQMTNDSKLKQHEAEREELFGARTPSPTVSPLNSGSPTQASVNLSLNKPTPSDGALEEFTQSAAAASTDVGSVGSVGTGAGLFSDGYDSFANINAMTEEEQLNLATEMSLRDFHQDSTAATHGALQQQVPHLSSMSSVEVDAGDVSSTRTSGITSNIAAECGSASAIGFDSSWSSTPPPRTAWSKLSSNSDIVTCSSSSSAPHVSSTVTSSSSSSSSLSCARTQPMSTGRMDTTSSNMPTSTSAADAGAVYPKGTDMISCPYCSDFVHDLYLHQMECATARSFLTQPTSTAATAAAATMTTGDDEQGPAGEATSAIAMDISDE
ncbi:serine-rich adhesin for platelets-like isoform X2 [Sycon ciliatum]|uniref:serine-rich adhesin for platelets-like isoform X2 n=1 Tax=Sycon ciliatum TaxID=27933 RepID=UPI0031F66E75